MTICGGRNEVTHKQKIEQVLDELKDAIVNVQDLLNSDILSERSKTNFKHRFDILN